MDTDMFKKLVWLLPNFRYNNPDQRVTDYSVRSQFTNGVTMTTSGGGGFPVVTEDGIQLLSESISGSDGNTYYNGTGRQVLDLQSSNLNITLGNGYVDLTNNYVEIGEYGDYNISLDGIQSRLAGAYSSLTYLILEDFRMRVNLEVQTVGQTSWNIISGGDSLIQPTPPQASATTSANSSYSDIKSINLTRYFNKGDKLRITLGMKVVEANSWVTPINIDVFYQALHESNFNIEIVAGDVYYGQTYDLKDVINSNYKQIDFVKGIAHSFNLQMSTDESTKTVLIEPFNTFYKPYGEAIDWTYKLDRSSEVSDKWIESELKRTLVFKYQSDSKDEKVKKRGEDLFYGIHDEYPYREVLNDTFKKGDSTFENPFFAGTYNTKDQDTTTEDIIDTAFSACLWTEASNSATTSRPDKGNEFLPRLLYWNRYTSNAAINQTPKWAELQTWSNQTKKAIASTNYPSSSAYAVYPQATMLNRDSTTSPNLAYGNAYVRDYNDETATYTSHSVGSGLYETYYRAMIEMLNMNPRLRTVSINLDTSDIIKLDFRKLVYIDGVYWRINRIIDYKPNQNESTKVELVEWSQTGILAPTAPSFGSSGTAVGWNTGQEAESNEEIGL